MYKLIDIQSIDFVNLMQEFPFHISPPCQSHGFVALNTIYSHHTYIIVYQSKTDKAFAGWGKLLM